MNFLFEVKCCFQHIKSVISNKSLLRGWTNVAHTTVKTLNHWLGSVNFPGSKRFMDKSKYIPLIKVILEENYMFIL